MRAHNAWRMMAACLMLGSCASTIDRGAPDSGGIDDRPLTVEQKRLNSESLEMIWNKINETYWDPGFGGVDWNAAHGEYLEWLGRASTMNEARGVMELMIESLGVSHMAIVPSWRYGDETEQPGGADSAGPGIDIRVLEEKAIVTAVRKGSPAEAAGVMTGWEVSKSGDRDLRRIIADALPAIEDTVRRDLQLWAITQYTLRGSAGTARKIVFVDGDGGERSIELVLAEESGNRFAIGYLPEATVRFESREIGPDIGYIGFNCFLDPVYLMTAFNEAMESFMDKSGIVIDLRGNLGGMGAMVIGMAGWFDMERNATLGTLFMRGSELKLVVNPRPGAYKGRLAILVDGIAVSAAEFMSAGLQEMGRAVLFGTRTAGVALPSEVVILPNGDGFQCVTGNYLTAGGRVLEGCGVIPDVEVRQTRAALLDGRDEALEAAAAWIREKAANSHDE